MDKKSRLLLLPAALIEISLYIFLHESGHALVMLACGEKISAFSIFGAFVSGEGGVYNQASSSLLHCAGVLFPLVLAFCYMLFFYNADRPDSLYRLFSMLFSLVPLMGLLAWVFVPVAYMAGDKASPDDVVHFLNASGVPPVAVMITALAVLALGLTLAWKKGIVRIWMELVRVNRRKTTLEQPEIEKKGI